MTTLSPKYLQLKKRRSMGEIEKLQNLIEDFAKKRDWDKFHTAKNLALALGSEVGELQAEFRWLAENENLTDKKLNSIKDELADVSIFLFRLAQVLKIDLSQAVQDKLLDNEKRNLDGPNFSN
jgi:NTP pyrophosphatase (non-canonical NTP hydrolase)